MSNHNSHVTREKLVDDVKVLIKDVQELLKATTSVVGDKATEARSRVQDSLKVAQDKVGEHYETVRAKGQEAFNVTDGYVRDNPWNAVGIAAGVGFILGIGFSAGVFLRRRDDGEVAVMADPQVGGSGGPAASSGPSLFASLRSFWSVLLAILYTRLDLATVELQDQGLRVIQLLLAGFIAVVALITAFFFFNCWFIAAYWDTTHRLLVIGIIFAVYALAGVIAAAIATSIVKSWPGFLSQTIKELRKDVEGLQVLIAKDKETMK